MKEKKIEFGLKVMKENPKPNADEFTIKTLEDISDIITEENKDRFFEDFKSAFENLLSMRKLFNSDEIDLPELVWIDD